MGKCFVSHLLLKMFQKFIISDVYKNNYVYFKNWSAVTFNHKAYVLYQGFDLLYCIKVLICKGKEVFNLKL